MALQACKGQRNDNANIPMAMHHFSTFPLLAVLKPAQASLVNV
jgi:hypothetical protein